MILSLQRAWEGIQTCFELVNVYHLPANISYFKIDIS